MKAVSLLSVGIDSPVATQLMTSRGVEVIGINFSQGNEDLLKRIMEKTGVKRCIVMDMNHFQKSIRRDEKMRCIMCKRFMYRIAERIGKEEGAEFIITGENIGQVASQTISNMVTISKSVSIDVVRPLLCYDKNDIIKVARETGTYSLSIERNGRCPYVPASPSTRTIEKRVRLQESHIPLQDLMDEAISNANEIHLKKV